VKTVLPNQAHAKITCRLVASQDPAKIVELLLAHVEQHAPRYLKVTATPLRFTAQPYLMPADHPANQIVRDVLVEMYGREPYYIRSGGSIPVCTLFHTHLGAYTASFGFGLDDEGLHAPNEFFRLSSFEKGQGGYCKLLHKLGGYTPA
jgi:acetylornithine deacetylase/succinyl-diaminopimelate desuccinylase-like protein